jgi:hypothetical protein
MKNFYTNKAAALAHEVFSRTVFVFMIVSVTSIFAAALEIIWNEVLPLLTKYREITLWQSAVIVTALLAWSQAERLFIHLRINKKMR